MNSFRRFAGALALCGAGALYAGPFVSNSPDPFSNPNFGFGIPGAGLTCFPTLCTSDNTSHDYQYVSKSFAGGNEIAQLTATFSGVLYDANGNKLDDYSGLGNVDIEIFGRASESTGSWNAALLRDDFTLTLDGHTFGLTLDPNNASTGQISVTALQALNDGELFFIDTSFNVNSLFTVDPGAPGGFAGAPVAFPLNETNLSASPEPASALLLLAPLGMGLLPRRRGARVG